jgi:type IV secretion system protein VirB1
VITGMEIACQHMAVPAEVMQHVVNVESAYNPYAIGVVGGQLVRQPKSLAEAEATVRMLESKGYNFSVGLAQVNRANLSKYGITTYDQAFDVCPNLTAGARILSECYASSGNDWGKSFSCYYSGNFVTGYRDGYVQKIYDSINNGRAVDASEPSAVMPIQLVNGPSPSSLHDAISKPTRIAASDDASYRLAIRSTLLDTAATLATRPLIQALATSPTDQPSAPVAASGIAAADVLQGNAVAPPNQTAKITGVADVFEPQVHSLGEALPVPTTAVTAAPVQSVATASAAAGDAADLRQGGQDGAFVF